MKPTRRRASRFCASTDWPKIRASPVVAGVKASQHLHRGGFAAAVRAEKAKDLAALVSKLTLSTAVKSPNRLVRFSVRMVGGPDAMSAIGMGAVVAGSAVSPPNSAI